MSQSHASESVVLRAIAYGESDKIVTFLSDDFGKLTGIAKGAKNSRRRFANCLDPLTRVRAHFRQRMGATLVFLESCDLLCAAALLAEPRKFAYANYLVELVDRLTEEAQPVPEVYRLLVDALRALEVGPASAAFVRAFELRLLDHAGYAPPLDACRACRRPLDTLGDVFLDPGHGVFVCAACRGRGGSDIGVTAATVAALAAIRVAPLAEVQRRRLAPETASGTAQIMGHLLAPHLSRPLRSVHLIAALARTR